jgi:UTP--glucose-1-phosphate uridylyltransferase
MSKQTISKCLFPAAGYGTRFLPATKAIAKEMLPILTKPLIQYGVEEAVSAGCNTMAIVTSKYKKSIEDHFDRHTDIEANIAGSSKAELLSEVNSIIDSCQFTYTRQLEMKGLGHAILTGKPLIGNEPFAVILADDLCDNTGTELSNEDSHGTEVSTKESHGTEVLTSAIGEPTGTEVSTSAIDTPSNAVPKSVLSQMIEVYEKYPGHCIVAVEQIPPEDSNKYGVIAGKNITDNIIQVENMVEKPEPKDAPSNLAIIGRYILIPEIFDIIETTKPGKGGEIQITDALLTLAKEGKVLAYEFEGKRFDCGSIDGFVEATNYFYKRG